MIKKCVYLERLFSSFTLSFITLRFMLDPLMLLLLKAQNSPTYPWTQTNKESVYGWPWRSPALYHRKDIRVAIKKSTEIKPNEHLLKVRLLLSPNTNVQCFNLSSFKCIFFLISLKLGLFWCNLKCLKQLQKRQKWKLENISVCNTSIFVCSYQILKTFLIRKTN